MPKRVTSSTTMKMTLRMPERNVADGTEQVDRQLLASIRESRRKEKRDSTTRKTYLNAECYESREKELLDRMAFIDQI